MPPEGFDRLLVVQFMETGYSQTQLEAMRVGIGRWTFTLLLHAFSRPPLAAYLRSAAIKRLAVCRALGAEYAVCTMADCVVHCAVMAKRVI